MRVNLVSLVRTDREQYTVSVCVRVNLVSLVRCVCMYSLYTALDQEQYTVSTQPWCGLEQCTATCVEALGLTW